MSDWKSWSRGDGRPSPTPALIDVKYLDGKEFHRKPIENCYWGADSLIESWRPSPAPTE